MHWGVAVGVLLWGAGGVMTYRELRSEFPEKTITEALAKAAIWPIPAIFILLRK